MFGLMVISDLSPIIIIIIVIIIIITENIINIITYHYLQTSSLQKLRKDYQTVDDYYTVRTDMALSSSGQSKLTEQSIFAMNIAASLPDSLSVVIDEMNGRVEQVGEIKYVFESSQNSIISGK